MVEIPRELRQAGEDVRSSPEFGRIRHEIWTLLREEVMKAQEQERRRRADRTKERATSEEVVAHG